jgi:hypothetical protein
MNEPLIRNARRCFDDQSRERIDVATFIYHRTLKRQTDAEK